MRTSAIAADAESENVGMFDEQQEIAHATVAALLHECPLQGERLGVRHATQAPDLYTTFGSQFSSDRLTIDMNSSATAPSITR